MDIDKTHHQPKGSMCIQCVNRSQDCSKLPFNKMKTIEMWMGIHIVACTSYNKKDD